MTKIGLLDTTMGFHRRDPLPEVRTHVEDFLSDFQLLGTSTYAHLEFKRSYIVDLAYLHRILKQRGSIPDTIAHVNRALGSDQRTIRKLKRVLYHLANFTRLVEGSTSDKKTGLMLDYIENAIESDYEWFIEVDFVHDGTACVRAKEPPVVGGGRIDVSVSQCRPEKIRCQIHEFFNDKRDKFTAIRERISSLEPAQQTAELKQFALIISEAEQNPTRLCSDKVCRKLGDALIAMDCTTGTPNPGIVSSNRRDYAPICESLNLEFFRYDLPPLPA